MNSGPLAPHAPVEDLATCREREEPWERGVRSGSAAMRPVARGAQQPKVPPPSAVSIPNADTVIRSRLRHHGWAYFALIVKAACIPAGRTGVPSAAANLYISPVPRARRSAGVVDQVIGCFGVPRTPPIRLAAPRPAREPSSQWKINKIRAVRNTNHAPATML